MGDYINRNKAIIQLSHNKYRGDDEWELAVESDIAIIKKLPPELPVHNITMDDVLRYIDNMPEDVWQEFVACLECRGWTLKCNISKWCGSEFA